MKAEAFVSCLICAFMPTAFSLNCTKCMKWYSDAVTDSCLGPVVECPEPDNVCLAVFAQRSDNYGSLMFSLYQRDCGKPFECEQTGSQNSSYAHIAFSTSCCDTDNCTAPVPYWPPKNTTINGHECLDSQNESYEKEYMKCTGEETQCIYITDGTEHYYGCASETFCNNRFATAINYGNEVTISCTKPTIISHIEDTYQHCYECHTLVGQKCPDTRSACLPDQDVCIYMYVHETHEDKEHSEIIKRCGKSSECSRAGTIHSATKSIFFNTTCCDSQACTPPTPTMPVLSTKKNGLSCPSCFSRMAVGCLDREPVECTGDENHCIHYKSRVQQEHLFLSESLHGCAAANICTTGSSLVKYKWKIMKMDITCTGDSNNVNINFSLSLLMPLILTKIFYNM